MKNKILTSFFALTLLVSGTAFAAQSYYIPEDDQDPSVENVTCEEIGMGTKLLKKGSKGTSVTVLQDVMINAGYYDAEVSNGVFDTATLAAVKVMQAELGVKTDGAVGPLTKAAMRDLCVDFVRGS